MGKGISGGYAPLGAVAVRAGIRNSFREAGATFEHIFTFGGNPVSMAAGVAVLDAWEARRASRRASPGLDAEFRALLEPFRAYPFVGDIHPAPRPDGGHRVRARPGDEGAVGYPSDGVAVRFREAGLKHGIVVYPGTGMADGARGDIISLYPPLTITRDELGELAERLKATFDAVAPTLPR